MNSLLFAFNEPSDSGCAIAQRDSVPLNGVTGNKAQRLNCVEVVKFGLNVSKKEQKGRVFNNILPSCRVQQISSVAVRSRSCTWSDTSRVFGTKAISGEFYETL